MPIYRVLASEEGRRHMQQWRRGVLHTIGLLMVGLVVCATGMIMLDSSGQPVQAKVFRGLWNSLNLVTTLGDFTSLDQREKVFMMATMVFFLIIGGYALSRLTGILSSDAVMVLRENRTMVHKLESLTGHVIVIGFGAIGKMVAGRLRDAGGQVVIVDRVDALAREASAAGHLVVQGDAGVDEAVLSQAGIGRAQGLVVTIADPDRKLSITLMAHSRNPMLKITVTGGSAQRAALLRRAGASDVVITDELVAGALVDCLKPQGKA